MPIIKRRVALAKVESTVRTDATPVAGTDSIKVEIPVTKRVEARFNQPESTKPSLGSERSLYGGSMREITFDHKLVGSGAAGTAPPCDPLLRACGFGSTIVPATSVTYAPVSTGHETATIYIYRDGRLIRHVGCLGSVSFACEVGQPIVASFTFRGHQDVDESDTALPDPTFVAADPPSWLAGAFTVDGFAAVISSLSIEVANEIAWPESVNEPDGWGDGVFTSMPVNGSINPLDTLVADYAWDLKWRQNTLAALNTGVIGTVAGNRVAISVPAAQYREQEPGDREGQDSLDIGFDCRESTGDDQISIAFT